MSTRMIEKGTVDAAAVTRAEVEDFLYAEAAMLDDWQLDEWLMLLTDDATYHVPSNDRPESNPRNALFTIADDINRIRARVKRLKDVNAHAESPRSRTRRMIHNVRILHAADGKVHAAANFVVYRFRRGSPTRRCTRGSASARSSGSTLRMWQQRSGLLSQRFGPSRRCCSATDSTSGRISSSP